MVLTMSASSEFDAVTKSHHPLHENVRGFWDIIDYGASEYTSRVESFMRTNGTWYDSYASYSVHFDALSTDDLRDSIDSKKTL